VTKLDDIYMRNLEVDAGEVVNIDELTEKARESIQPSLFDLGVVNQVGYGIPPVDVMMTEDDRQFSGQLKSTIGKGMAQETIGFVGDMLGILKGVYNMTDRQWEELSQRIKDPTVQPKVRGLLESFLAGFSDIEELGLPPGLGMTSEAADKMLTEMGWDPVSKANTPEKKEILEGVKIGAQVLSPAPTGAATEVIKRGAKVVKGLDDAKKSFNIPSVVYHGTNANFSKFDKSKSEHGLYFASDKKIARQFGKNVKAVQLEINNPFVASSFEFDAGLMQKLDMFTNEIKRKIGLDWKVGKTKSTAGTITPYTEEGLKKKGYDGIVIPKGVGTLVDDVYIPFDVSQIKIVKDKK